MAYVNVFHGRDRILSKNLDGVQFYVGRGEGADILLDNPAISRNHALIYREGERWRVKRLSLRSGIYVNGGKMNESSLKEGDRIEIGDYMLAFHEGTQSEDDAKAARINAAMSQLAQVADEGLNKSGGGGKLLDRTLALGTQQLRNIREEMKNLRSVSLMALTPMQPDCFALTKSIMTIGKAAQCDIRLPGGFTVGSLHARLTRHGENWYIEHLGGLSVTKVNGRKFEDTRRLNDEDEIEIGPHRFRFVQALETI